MKKSIIFLYAFLITIIFIPYGWTQSGSGYRGQSLNGATGLYSIPSGRIGWESGGFGFDAGYRAIVNNDRGISQIPAVTISLLNWIEISTAIDIQPVITIGGSDQENNDLMFGVKFRLPTGANTSVAFGGNMQMINIANKENYNYFAYQPYMAITYTGTFFNMTAETTVVFGKTFYTFGPDNNSDIDFGMGFDIILFPDVFGNAVHWIIDFANFSYSDNAWTNNLTHGTGSAWHRGILNTGFRIDLSTIPGMNHFKVLLDLIFNDLFDAGSRSFTVGAVFGFGA